MCKWHDCAKFVQKWFSLESSEDESGKYSLQQLTQEACSDLKKAHELLNWVTDPDMVEYAIYSLKAAEKRYDYMIKQIKNQQKQLSLQATNGLGGV